MARKPTNHTDEVCPESIQPRNRSHSIDKGWVFSGQPLSNSWGNTNASQIIRTKKTNQIKQDMEKKIQKNKRSSQRTRTYNIKPDLRGKKLRANTSAVLIYGNGILLPTRTFPLSDRPAILHSLLGRAITQHTQHRQEERKGQDGSSVQLGKGTHHSERELHPQ